MKRERFLRRLRLLGLSIGLVIAILACNLTSPPPEPETVITEVSSDTTATITQTAQTTTTQIAPLGTITIVPLPTRIFIPPATSVPVLPPTSIPAQPVNTQIPASIVILSPASGNVVAGNVQVLGSAIHPDFLQYHLEFAPDPNPGNIWYPITGAVQTPITNSVLGIWNTNTQTSPDAVYQIRLRVVLRDGRQLSTTVNGIQVRNAQPTPIPTNTAIIPAPVASFTQTRTSGEAPLTISFANQSQGDINNYDWDFGDGTSSSEINPTHTFQNPGIYTVRLTVSGPGGVTNVSRQIDAQSPSAPEASFSQNTTGGDVPLTVNFNSTSSGNITSYQWDFGDGNTSNVQNPSHTYTTPGTYNVILTVAGQGGSSTSVRQVVATSRVNPPVAGFSASTLNGTAPLTVQFTNTSTGDNLSYDWDMNGDGITDRQGRNPSYTYDSPGTYLVTLTTTNSAGASASSAQINVNEAIEPPQASFSASTYNGVAPLTVNFSSTSTGDVVSYDWDFNNDGATDSTSPIADYTFSQAGSHTVTLRVRGQDNSTSVATDVINVSAPVVQDPIQAGFVMSTNSGPAPLTVSFSNTSTGNISSYEWDFNGDGIVDDTSVNPVYTYPFPGNFLAILTVRSPQGETSSYDEEVAAFLAPDEGESPGTGGGNGNNNSNNNNNNSNNNDQQEGGSGTGGGEPGSENEEEPQFNPPNINTGSEKITYTASANGNLEIFLANPDGSDEVNLTNFDANDFDSVLSPDRTKVAFVSDRSGNNEIYVMNLNDTSIQQLTFNPSNDQNPAWSPDGESIAFTSDRFGNNNIHVLNASDGSTVERITQDNRNNSHPSWSQDGARLVYSSRAGGTANLYVVNANGNGQPEQITEGNFLDTEPRWSPTRAQIVFTSNRDGTDDIYTVNANGNQLNRQVGSNSGDSMPTWSPDGNSILFVSDRGSSMELFVKDAGSPNTQRVTNSPRNITRPDWR